MSTANGNNNGRAKQHSKKNKRKLCPECESGYLISSIKKKIVDGVIFTERIMFCPECDYRHV
jgi:ribosomal protein S27AE